MKNNILAKIVKYKQKELRKKKKEFPLNKFKDSLTPSKNNFKDAISDEYNEINFIAEIKKASPSEGTICENINIKKIMSSYNKYAQAISVLTDKKFFKGSGSAIKEIRKYSDLPILRKDFTLDEYDIYESRYLGADAVLLITSLLSRQKISDLIQKAKELNMAAVVEIHNKKELQKAIQTNAEIIMINNRNLNSFKINLNTTEKLINKIPKSQRDKLTLISASGITERTHVEKLSKKVNALLIGTAFMKSKNIETVFKTFKGIPLVKICGITSKKDADNAVKAGADFIGFNFYRQSPRYIKPKKASEIIEIIPSHIQTAGVFVNEKKSAVKKIKKMCKLDLLQFHGNENNKYCDEFGNKKVIKAVRIKNKNSLKSLDKFKTEFLLLDSFSETFGGSGKSFDYSLAKKINRNIFLAGGLNSKNVCRAIETANPFAVDVCSGVEKSPGNKDFSEMKKFVEAVKNAKN